MVRDYAIYLEEARDICLSYQYSNDDCGRRTIYIPARIDKDMTLIAATRDKSHSQIALKEYIFEEEALSSF